MDTKYIIKHIIVFSGFAIFGLISPAFAQWGMGYGHHEMMHHGPGWHHQGYGPRGSDPWRDLSEDEIKQIDEQRKAFFGDTKEIRQQLYQKRLEIRSELAKKTPNAEMAAELQREIAALMGQMGQKRLDHILKLKKINPDIGRGLMGRAAMGYGMMDSRGYGGGLDCPFQGYGSGYGMGLGMMGPGMMESQMMGPGMMNPAMMGPGRGRHMMPGWPARDYPSPSQHTKGPLEEKDARAIVENYLKSTRNPNLTIGKIADVGHAYEAEIVTREKSLVDKVLVDKTSGWLRSTY
jgi:hypothetical protein